MLWCVLVSVIAAVIGYWIGYTFGHYIPDNDSIDRQNYNSPWDED